MNMSQIVEDGLELVDILKNKFSKKKIYLGGISWGSALGLKMIEMQPENFLVYIEIAQVVNIRNGSELKRDWLKKLATLNDDTGSMAAIDSLEIELIPSGLKALTKEMELVEKYRVHYEDADQAIKKALGYYEDYKIENIMNGVYFSIQFLEKDFLNINFDHLNKLDVPVYLIHGRNDWTNPANLTKEWFDNLNALKKEFLWMENSTHGPPKEESELFNKIIIDKTRVN